MKLKLVADGLLSQLEAEELRACLPDGVSFDDLIDSLKAQTIKAANENKEHPTFRKKRINNKFDLSWLG